MDDITQWTKAGNLQHTVSLKRLNTWRIGGNAQTLFMPASLEQLCQFIEKWQSEPIHFLGLGSNLLIPDDGIEGCVVLTRKGLSEIKSLDDGVYVGAGVTCAKLAKWCISRQCQGAFFAGIPGTIGGSIMMNAGAFGGETWQFLSSVQFVTDQGECIWRNAAEFQPGYRQVSGHFPGWVVGAKFIFPWATTDVKVQTQKLLKERSQKQPIGLASCGSVFKNQPPYFAAQLIEQSGLKGQSIGGATVSTKHANFIINQGDATAESILALVSLIKSKVYNNHGILLEEEFRQW